MEHYSKAKQTFLKKKKNGVWTLSNNKEGGQDLCQLVTIVKKYFLKRKLKHAFSYEKLIQCDRIEFSTQSFDIAEVLAIAK